MAISDHFFSISITMSTFKVISFTEQRQKARHKKRQVRSRKSWESKRAAYYTPAAIKLI